MVDTKIKQGDKFPVTLTVNHDLTGATTRLVVRHLTRTGEREDLDHTVTDTAEGQVTHTLDGTWGVGRHYLELEITQGGQVRTAPTSTFLVIEIVRDLDHS